MKFYALFMLAIALAGYRSDPRGKKTDSVPFNITVTLGNFSPTFSHNRGQLYDDNSKWGFIDSTGNLKIPYKYETIANFSEELAAFMLNGKWGYMDPDENEIIPAKYEEAYDFIGARASIKVKDEYGYINRSGIEIIKPTYIIADNFYQG